MNKTIQLNGSGSGAYPNKCLKVTDLVKLENPELFKTYDQFSIDSTKPKPQAPKVRYQLGFNSTEYDLYNLSNGCDLVVRKYVDGTMVGNAPIITFPISRDCKVYRYRYTSNQSTIPRRVLKSILDEIPTESRVIESFKTKEDVFEWLRMNKVMLIK